MEYSVSNMNIHSLYCIELSEIERNVCCFARKTLNNVEIKRRNFNININNELEHSALISSFLNVKSKAKKKIQKSKSKLKTPHK